MVDRKLPHTAALDTLAMNDGNQDPHMNAGHLTGKSSRRTAELSRVLSVIVSLGVSSLAPSSQAQSAADNDPTPAATTNAPSKFFSPEDGWPDMSGFLDQAYGFVPILMPITEPAVGYGAVGGLTFIDKPQGEAQAGFGRPNLTAVGGLGTENGTWGALGGDVRHWLDDRLQTQVGFVYASVNLDYYGMGENSVLQDHPLTYNLEPLGGLVRAKYRLGQSRFWAGLSYALANTQVRFDAPASTPGLPPFEDDSRIGGLAPSFTYDSRDNMFTPSRGTFGEVSLGAFSQAFGGDGEFQRLRLMVMQFVPLHPKLTLGVRGTSTLSFGEVPFYLRPFISLRGVQAIRYQGDGVADIEAELRWQFWKRFSLIGFAGGGVAWSDFERFDNSLAVVTGGTGFRYELARKYGLHMGIDVAFGLDERIFYVQFGSAWLRP